MNWIEKRVRDEQFLAATAVRQWNYLRMAVIDVVRSYQAHYGSEQGKFTAEAKGEYLLVSWEPSTPRTPAREPSTYQFSMNLARRTVFVMLFGLPNDEKAKLTFGIPDGQNFSWTSGINPVSEDEATRILTERILFPPSPSATWPV